ncbi:MAG: carbohydrate kinase family protein [Candidatus Bathyarchaeia archaeon]
MKLDVVCFGALNLDRLYRVDRIAKEGEERFVTDFRECPGGSAANTAAGLARLGLRVGYIGKVAQDREGALLLEDFKREGVDLRGIIISKGGRSGTVMGYVDPKGERALYVDPGVNDTLGFGEIDLEYASSAEFVHFTSFVGEKPLEAQRRLVEALRGDVKLSLDPGDLYARRGLTALKPILRRSLVVLPNEREIKLLTGRDYEDGARILMREGVHVVAVKLGGRGCYVTDGETSHLIEPFRVEVVDTTGAGDAFCTGFLYGLIKEKDLYECGRLGNFVASRCIQRVGAREGLPRIEDLAQAGLI